MRKIIGGAILFLFLTSCKSEQDFSNVITVSTVPTFAALVPISRQNCTDKNTDSTTNGTAASSLGWSSFRIEWKDVSRDLYLVSVKFILPEKVGGGTGEITDTTELDYMFGITEGKIPRKGTAGAPTGNIYKSDSTTKINSYVPCSLTYGGIAATEKIFATVDADIEVTGVAIDNFGNEEIIRSTATVSVGIDTRTN